MNATIRLGTVSGVRVGVHWSVLGIFVVLVLALGLAQWPSLVPGYPSVIYVVAAAVAGVLFLASLLAHELAHAIVARRRGVEVDGITLWLLGGVAKLRSEPDHAGTELRIALAGPLASVLVAVVLGLVAWVLVLLDTGTLVIAIAGYLALVNVILAAFNLIPAAPLDGGRVLRAVLWAWRGDRIRATVWSARTGRVFGFALILLGAWALLFARIGGGAWWILIGLFITTVAASEERQARIGATLADIRIRDVMSHDPVTVDGRMSVRRFLDQTAPTHQHSAFPLTNESGELQGLITLKRLRSVAPSHMETTELGERACPPDEVPRGAPGEPLNDLLGRMSGCTDGRALVFEEDALVGIVTPTDISRAVTLHRLDAGAPPDRNGAFADGGDTI